MKSLRTSIIVSFTVIYLGLMLSFNGQAQVATDPYMGKRIEAITITITNPTKDHYAQQRVIDKVRRNLALYANDTFREELLLFNLTSLTKLPEIAAITHQITFSDQGQLIISLLVTLTDNTQPGLTSASFPWLYQHDGTFIKARLELLGMYYANQDAWFGKPDLMLEGNPFVQGTPAGKGFSNWFEGFAHVGLYGITPVTEQVHVYGGASGILSGSIGQELFTDKTRQHFALEDAFLGVVGGNNNEKGDRFVYNLTAGRQRFSIGDGFILTNTSQNGLNRAALQSNPRWAADNVFLARMVFNNIKIEAFSVDADELPELDSKTVITGINAELKLANYLLGAAWMTVPESNSRYFTSAAQLSREGLKVANLRLRWQPFQAAPNEKIHPYFASEVAKQTHKDFDMLALGYFMEAGLAFPSLNWTPSLSYRYARFTGDKPATSTFERWDPLLSGGNGETWVQGINHFKIFQNSNLITHRLQVRLKPSPQIELVPQFWLFKADSLTNLGGNPALSFLPSTQLGTEFNLTAKYFYSRNIMLQGHLAATFSDKAVNEALGQHSSPWLSSMLFIRIGF
ncbi:hypothetical protein ACO1PK_15485 [Alishewanella sp. d11]|uniref:hypothetical protein n=1 Tax=Alishewanella sp. d11 TaxID=3414030 RepID=UPI003BF777DF